VNGLHLTEKQIKRASEACKAAIMRVMKEQSIEDAVITNYGTRTVVGQSVEFYVIIKAKEKGEKT